MEFYLLEMSLTIVLIIMIWTGCKAIKWIWTHVKRWILHMVGMSQDNQGVVNLNASEPLPSSSEPRVYKYDVFLSFRGSDTRKGITSDLYDRLRRRGVKTFMDGSDLQVGDAISPTLLKAIGESRFAIVVLSPNYASSPWCLDEVAKICECMKEENRILPVFYNVEPSIVRHRKRSFGEAFKKHESSGRYTNKVQRWKEALKKVASFSGWDVKNYKTDGELVEAIVDFVCKKIQPSDIEFIMSTGDFEAYEATKKAMGEVMEALEDDDVIAVAVHGLGGVGKTTMVKQVGARLQKNGKFHHVIIGVVSQRLDLTKIQDALAEQLGIEIKEKTESVRAAKLKTKIMRNEKILIILDDVWALIKLAEIGIPSYEELQMRNSKVVLTTRIGDVSSVMGCQKQITLCVLSKDDSWSLFVRNAGMSLELTRFEKVARRVAAECRGLPIALKAVARALGSKDLAEWEKAAQRLKRSQYANPSHDEDAFRCIKLSYDYLNDEDQKSCFLLCCLYPEDHEIKIEDLFRYVVGTRFFQIAETIEEARGTLVSIVKHLNDSSLLLDGWESGCVKMHDVIRDTAIQIAETERGFLVKAGIGLENWPRGLDQGCTAISLMGNEIHKLPEEELVCPHLQILLLNRNAALDEIPESFMKRLNELRVFDVSNTSISVLPQSFSLLTNLQALYLNGCHKLNDISIVGKLKNLEILRIRSLKKYLPREIGDLTNLRILDINRYSSRVTIPCKVISKLHKLEELYMGHCEFESSGCEVEGRGEETKIGFGEIAGLSNLERLHVGIPHHKCIPNDVEAKPDWDYFSITIGRPGRAYQYGDHDSRSRSLILRGASISMLPGWFINAVANKIETLECTDYEGSLVMEHDRGRLHELKHLKIYGDSGPDYRKELVNTTDRVQKGPLFEKLETLYLMNLFHIEELWVGDLPPGSLVNLKVLDISRCAVKNISKFVQRLPSLEEIDLSYLGKLEYVFGCEGFELKESKLREVRLSNLDSMKSICSGRAPRVMFESIKILTISWCGLLQSLLASDVAQCLSQLEDLRVEYCHSLERVIEEVKKEKTALPKLKNLVLEYLPKLYGASSGTVDIECPSLEQVVMVDCPHLPFSIPYSNLFKSSEGLGS